MKHVCDTILLHWKNTSGEHGNAVQIETKNKRFPEDLV